MTERSKPSAEGVEPRRAALRILDRVLRGGQTVDGAAHFASRLGGADQALAMAIVGETLRRIPELDALIDSATRQNLPPDSKARMVLRLALSQKLALNVPDHALVATALPLVDGGLRRLVHGVLGTLLRRNPAANDAPPLPADVEARWSRAWGGEVVEAARRQIAARPPLDLSFRTEDAAQSFVRDTGAVSLAPRHARLAESGAISALPGFAVGDWWVQDLAASLPARLVPPGATEVLDACAAPGGKTMQLAAAGHRVLALDRSGARVKRLADNLARTGLTADVVVADAFDWDSQRRFDAVLVDAPCSATGTFRRHPEVLHRVRPSYICEAADAQLKLLERARDWLRPGGTLVYSVCSLEREEGEQVARAFLDSNADFSIGGPEGLPQFAAPAPEGWLRVLPGLLEEQGGLDGFFTARLVRAVQ